MALDKNFTFRSMTRQDYFCLYDAIHTLVRQDEITKEQVLSPHASERVRSFSTRTRARPRAHTQKYRRDLCGIISPYKIFFSSIAVSILVAFLRILLEGSTKVRMQHTAHMFRDYAVAFLHAEKSLYSLYVCRKTSCTTSLDGRTRVWL